MEMWIEGSGRFERYGGSLSCAEGKVAAAGGPFLFQSPRAARVNSIAMHVTGAWRQESERDSNARIKYTHNAPFASQRAKT